MKTYTIQDVLEFIILCRDKGLNPFGGDETAQNVGRRDAPLTAPPLPMRSTDERAARISSLEKEISQAHAELKKLKQEQGGV